MTEPELNEKVARLMGWLPVGGGHWQHPDTLSREDGSLPDYLDPKRLHELINLAATMGNWDLSGFTDGSYYACLTGHGNDPFKACSSDECSASITLARVIVAYAEHKTRATVVAALKEVVKEPLEPPPLKLGVNMTGWKSCPHCGCKSKVGE